MTRPLVLISNDDGIESPLLQGLADALDAEFETWVVAPERQRSAASHAITLHKPLRLTEKAPRRYSLSGTPVDCVYVGLLKVVPRRPALVVSGVNAGFNLGTDVYYSGTVAAAREGVLRGVPGLALSAATSAALSDVIKSSVSVVMQLVSLTAIPPATLVNVNIPAAGPRQTVWSVLGQRYYADDVCERADPWGRSYIWLGGGATGHADVPGSDCEVVAAGNISVTPISVEFPRHTWQDQPPW